jgi:SAM-dependent methyltransferase
MAQARYIHGHHESVLRSHRWRTAENSAAYLIGHLRPGHSLLDVGCGAGTITAGLAALVAPGRVTAIDASSAAVEETRQVVSGRGIGNVDCAAADAYATGFADGSFDVVHAHQVLQHLADPVRALREMRRVCKPGGIVAARDGDYGGFTWYPAVPALDEWMSLYCRVARANDGEPDGGRHLLSWARQAGFSDVAASASTWCFATPEDRAWWGGTWAERIVDSVIADRAVSGGYATADDLKRISDGWRKWVAADDGWFAILHGEVICRPAL